MAATVVVPSAIVLEVLNENNYDQWSVRVKTYLMAKDLWDVVEATTDPSKAKEEEAEFKLWKKKKAKDLSDVVEATTEPPKAKDEEAEFKLWKKKNAEALHVIQISCGTALFSFIATLSTAKMAWDTLEKTLKYTLRPKNIEKRERPLHTSTDAKEEELVLNEDNEIEATNGSEPDNSDLNHYRTFFEHMESGNWDDAKVLVKENPTLVRVGPPPSRRTALHVAVRNKHEHIVKELVGLMTKEDLELNNAYGDTAFKDAIYTGITKMVQWMVEKNNKLLGIRFPNRSNRITPVLLAYGLGYSQMARYLYGVTPDEHLNGTTDGAELITQCVFAKDFVLARNLIQRWPNLTTTLNYSGQAPLHVLAGMRSGYLNESQLTFCERWIYKVIWRIQPTSTIDSRKKSTPSTINDTSIDIEKLENGQDDNQRDLNCSDVEKRENDQDDNRRDLICSGIFNRIYDMKRTHDRVHDELIGLMCKKTNLSRLDIITPSIFEAVKGGHVEFIKYICEARPTLRKSMDTKGRTIFHCAVEYRQEKVYSLIYGLPDEEKKSTRNYLDNLNNTMLHAAANLSPSTAVKGAALQMQRELQWFKEVESMVPARVRECKNFIDGMTARELFTKNHRELLKEGEKSMKETATSCTVVGALIVTIMFAAAFTVPGGNNGDTGIPIFLDQMVFMAFIVSDALSLFTSTTSVMIFLGILTSRYAEDDFLKSLPTKMIFGLVALFFSIATMMIAFSSALFIMLHERSWIVIPVILLASVPVTSFILLQFPFLVEIVISTYGSGIFDKKVKW